MKKVVFSFCLIAISMQFFAQTKRHSLEVKSDDKPGAHGFSFWQQVKINSKDTSIVASLHGNKPTVLKNLKAETYTVTATSLFNHHIQKKVELNKGNSFIKLSGLESFYTKVPTTTNLSEKIKLNDTLYVIFNSTANENTKEKIGVTKTKTGYTAIQYVGISNEVFQEMQINETSYKAVIKLETEGKKASTHKTANEQTSEIYTIELNKEITTFVIGGQWNGINGLKAVLFLVEKK